MITVNSVSKLAQRARPCREIESGMSAASASPSCAESDRLHEDLQRALIARDFETARKLSRALGQAIICQASAAALCDRAILIQQGLSRLGEHLNLARVQRSHLAAQLQTTTAVCFYTENSGRGHSWRFDG